MNPTPQQQLVIDTLKLETSSVVNSLAGSGKTTTAAIAIADLPKPVMDSTALVAYNRHITEYDRGKCIPEMAPRVKTFNGFGHLACLRRFSPQHTSKYLMAEKYSYILRDLMPEMPFKEKNDTSKYLRGMIDQTRNQMVDPTSTRDILKMITHFGWEMPEDSKGRPSLSFDNAQQIVIDAIKRGAKECSTRIDYIDQVYQPATREDISMTSFKRLLIDEVQDANPMQLALARKMSKNIMAIGDSNQAIFGFQGAMVDSMDRLQESLNAVPLKLTVCWRCPTSHINLAKSLVPELEAAPGAIEGEINSVYNRDMIRALRKYDLSKTAIICRTNQPLIDKYHELVMSKIPAKIQGKGFGVSLTSLVEAVTRRYVPWSDFLTPLKAYHAKRVEQLEKEEGNEMAIQSLDDRVDSLKTFYFAADEEGCNDYPQFMKYIENSFVSDDDKFSGVLLSTGHGIKGKEFENTFLLRRDLCPHPKARKGGWETVQEYNLLYIMYTRSTNRMFFVEKDSFEGEDAWAA